MFNRLAQICFDSMTSYLATVTTLSTADGTVYNGVSLVTSLSVTNARYAAKHFVPAHYDYDVYGKVHVIKYELYFVDRELVDSYVNSLSNDVFSDNEYKLVAEFIREHGDFIEEGNVSE